MQQSQSNGPLVVAIRTLLTYCQSNNWAGYDPYDALNSKPFAAFPVLGGRIPRLVLTQAMKRLPVNLRPLLGIPKTQNPKALGLFLSGIIRLKQLKLAEVDVAPNLIPWLIELLALLRSPNLPYSCWGYSFPWQTRTVVVPSGSPNLVCTTFVANALFDAYEHYGNGKCLDMALSAAEYILGELYWTDGSASGFAYPLPSVRHQVHNANFLAAALLARAHVYTRKEKFLSPALQAARHSTAMQQADGSWYYGEATSQRWIDNFHTGYNLCALQALAGYAGTTEFDSAIRQGFAFYRRHFFVEDGFVRYFHDRTYPIDIHSLAQSIITLAQFCDINSENLRLAHSVGNWALAHMWDERGYFYYRRLRHYTNRISYMRWSQAWMLLAMVVLLEADQGGDLGKTGQPLGSTISAHA